MAQSTIERLSRHLECAVCLEIYNDPKALPCQHTFCLSCIHQTLRGNTLQCPSCKNFHKVPNGGPEEFPNNYTLLPMIEEFKQIQLQEECNTVPMVSVISAETFTHAHSHKQGLADLAVDSLKEIEKRADSFDLIVNRIQALQENLSSTSASIKSTITADIGHLIKCLQEREHELHDKVALHTHAETGRLQSLKCEVAAHARQLRHMCNLRRTDIEKCPELTNEQWKGILQEGDQNLQYITRVCKRFEEVQYEAIEFSANTEQQEQVGEYLKRYGHLFVLKKSQQLLPKRNRLHSLPEAPRQSNEENPFSCAMQKRSSTLPPNPWKDNSSEPLLLSIDAPRFRSKSSSDPRERSRRVDVSQSLPCDQSSIQESACAKKFCNKEVSNWNCSSCDISERLSPFHGIEQGTSEDDVRERTMAITQPSSTQNTRSPPFQIPQNGSFHFIHESETIIEGSELDPLYPLGIADLSSDVFAIASGSALRVFNSQGAESTPRAPLRTKKARVLADVCCLPNETIIATDSFNNEVLQFSSKGRPRGSLPVDIRGRKLNKPIKPYGITCDQRGFLFICDRENKCVLVCRPNGVVDKVIGANRLKDPLYVILNKTETVMYVTDCQSAAVVVFTIDGDFVRMIPKEDSRSPDASQGLNSSAKFSRPSGVAVTPDDDLVVCDSDFNVVQILNPTTGALKALISVDQPSASADAELDNRMHLDRPMGVTYFENTQVIAVCDTSNNRVQMFKLSY